MIVARVRTPARASLVAALLSLAAAPARAGGGVTDAYDGVRAGVPVDVHGLADLYAQYDFARPPDGNVPYREFTPRAGLGLRLLRLGLAHRPPPSCLPLGFRIDVGLGDTADDYRDTDPASIRHPDLARGLSYVQQAFVSAVLPTGTDGTYATGLEVDAGKFSTPVGFEDNETLSNWNDSRSLLFSLAEPAYHFGARATYAASRALALSLFWVNGWDTNFVDGNGMRTLAGALAWRPIEALDLAAVYMAGPERAARRLSDPALAFRHEVAASVVLRPASGIAFAAAVDHGADALDGGVTWWGVGGYARYEPWPFLVFSLRVEHYADPDGFTSGTPQRLAELTATIELRLEAGPLRMTFRPEYRRDQSDVPVFATAGARTTHIDTAAVSTVVAF
jgi:hypothetical protein